MLTVWKSRGRVREVFVKFWEGGYIGGCESFGGGYHFMVFYCIFINKFCKNFGGRVHFYPPLTPPPPVCIYDLDIKSSITTNTHNPYTICIWIRFLVRHLSLSGISLPRRRRWRRRLHFRIRTQASGEWLSWEHQIHSMSPNCHQKMIWPTCLLTLKMIIREEILEIGISCLCSLTLKVKSLIMFCLE